MNTDRGVPAFGTKGASIHVQGMLKAFCADGHEVHLITTRQGPGKPLAGVHVHALPVPSAEAPSTADEALPGLLNDLQPDLVYERHALWSSSAMRWANGAGVPGVLEVNAPLVEEAAKHRGLDAHEAAAARGVAREAHEVASVVVAVSAAVAEACVALGAQPADVHVIGNGVDPDRFAATAQPVAADRAPDATFTVGFVGTLRPWHGIDLLVEAMQLLRQHLPARLLIVGDGPAAVELDGVPDVEHVGTVEPQQVAHYVARMDVGVAPYPGGPFYFSPLKILDYMMAGVPVVATDVGDLRSMVPEAAGFVAAPDAPSLAAALLAVARMPAAERQAMGAAGRQHVLDHHTWSHVANKVLTLVGRVEVN